MAAFPSRIVFACLLLLAAAQAGCAADPTDALAPVDYVVDDPRPGLAVGGGGNAGAGTDDKRPGLPVATRRPSPPAAEDSGRPFLQAAPAGTVERRALPSPGKQDGGTVPAATVAAGLAPPPAATPSDETMAAAETVVAPGETLNAVSRRTGVPLRTLIEANHLTSPFILRPGDRLTLPQVRSHTVQSGDTVYNISRRYGVDQSSLMAANNIAPPYTIRLGQVLRVPGRVDAVAAPAQNEAPERPAAAAHPVAAGPLVLSPPVDRRPVEPPPPVVLSVAPGHLIPPPSVKPPAIVEPDPDHLPPPRTTAAVPPKAATGPGAAAAGRFIWPVAGDVVSRYGPRPGGQHNDGINVQAVEGSTVRAADSGVVAYAGNEIRGYGNLLLIRHAQGWMSAYAHCRRLLVKKGDTVARGQAIAEVGRTGNVTVPQLHFEIRQDGEALDPLTVLPGGA